MSARDETLCRRCGRCCAKKLFTNDGVMFLPTFCEFLDLRTRLCTIYAERFERNPLCLTLEEGIQLGVFPADCPYVREIPGYPPPVEHPDPADLERYLEGLSAEERRAIVGTESGEPK